MKYSLGTEIEAGVRYCAFPVTNGVADYEEYYALTEEEYALFLAGPNVAVKLVEEGRRREHDELPSPKN